MESLSSLKLFSVYVIFFFHQNLALRKVSNMCCLCPAVVSELLFLSVEFYALTLFCGVCMFSVVLGGPRQVSYEWPYLLRVGIVVVVLGKYSLDH